MQGAFILVVANALVKVIGAVFKIPLARLLGNEGMGLFSTSYIMYTWMFIVATAGLPVAISKMVSESSALGRGQEVKRIFRVSVMVLSVIGILGSSALYFGAEFFSLMLGSSRAVHGIRAVAPAMLFVSIMSAYRGFFQGMQNMIPTAISEVVEALGKLLLGFAFASFFLSRGLEFGAAGAVFGVSAGAFLGCLILFFIHLFRKKHIYKDVMENGESRSYTKLLLTLIRIAVPITIGASVFSLTSVIDMSMIMRRLQSIGFSEAQATALWGSYSGFAVPLFNLPPTLISALSVSLVPAVAAAFAKREYTSTGKTVASSLRITVLFALPCAVGMAVLSEPILHLVYNNTDASTTLSILSCSILFVSLVLVTNSILQATGHEMIPVFHMLIGGGIKIITNYTLVGMPDINIVGAPIGTGICYIFIFTLNLIAIRRVLKINIGVFGLFVKPVIAALAMGAGVLVVYKFTASLGSLATVFSIGMGAVIYLAVLLMVKALRRDDIIMLPKGQKIAEIMDKYRLLR